MADQATDTYRAVMYAGQSLDCLNTANALLRPGTYETNPTLAPGSKLGHTFISRAVGVCGSYAVEDVVAGYVERALGFSELQKRIQASVQIGSNVWGITLTIRNTGR